MPTIQLYSQHPQGYVPGGAVYRRPPPPKPRRFIGPPQGYAPGGVVYAPLSMANQAPAPATTKRPPAKPAMTLWEQAQALIQKALAPQIAATNAQYDRESAAERASIAGATKEYERAVAGFAPAMGAAYAEARGQQSAGDAALANLLGGAGGQAASDLSAKLGAPAGSEAAAALQATGRGAAASTFGMGSADLDRLIAQGVNAQEYGRRLPGWAALTGLQDTTGAVKALGQKRMDALGQIRATGAQQTVNLYGQMRSEKATAANEAANRTATALENERNRQLNRDLAQLTSGTSITKANIGAATAAASLKERIAHDKAIEDNQAASIEQRRAAAHDRYLASVALRQKQAGTAKARHGKQRDSAFYSARKSAFSDAAQLARTGGGGGGNPADPFNLGGGKGHAVSRHVAYYKLWNKYAAQLINQWGFKPAAVNKMIQAALNNSYKKPPKPKPPKPKTKNKSGAPGYSPLYPPALPGT